MNVIVPVAGEGRRFREAGFQDPKPFIRVAGKRMIEWALEPIPIDWKIHLICQEKHLFNFAAWNADKNFYKSVSLYPLAGITQGAACTILAALVGLPANEPVAVMNGDQYFHLKEEDKDLNTLCEAALGAGWDGFILTFTGEGVRWSYVRVVQGFVQTVREKEPISDQATVGFYWFRRADDLLRACAIMIAENIRHAGEFYLAPCYNELIWRFRRKVKAVPVHSMFGLGTPEDVQTFEQVHHLTLKTQRLSKE